MIWLSCNLQRLDHAQYLARRVGVDPRQADSWRLDAAALVDSIATARRQHEGFRLSTRWNAQARRQRAALGQAEEALRSGERIAIYTRSMARALVDGSGHARPMPALSAMLASGRDGPRRRQQPGRWFYVEGAVQF